MSDAKIIGGGIALMVLAALVTLVATCNSAAATGGCGDSRDNPCVGINTTQCKDGYTRVETPGRPRHRRRAETSAAPYAARARFDLPCASVLHLVVSRRRKEADRLDHSTPIACKKTKTIAIGATN